jgi:phage tail-like protein
MPTFRETPYGAFNFLVELGDGDATQPVAGFSEVSGLNAEMTVAEYRAGNDKNNYVHKVAGLTKSGDITLKRGLMGAQNLYDWLDQMRRGEFPAAKRLVTIRLLDEARNGQVVSWKLRGAMPLKWTGPTLNAKGGTDVAMEEFVLSVELVEQE